MTKVIGTVAMLTAIASMLSAMILAAVNENVTVYAITGLVAIVISVVAIGYE